MQMTASRLSDFTPAALTQTEAYDQLRHRCRVLSAESFSTVNILDRLREMLPSAISAITQLAPGKPEAPPLADFSFTGEAKSVLKLVEHQSFLDYERTLVQVPEGFTGDLLTYLKELCRIGEEMTTQAVGELQTYVLILSAFLSNADARNSLRDQRSFAARLKMQREHALDRIAPFFKKNSALSLQPIGNVFSRFADLNAIYVEAARLQGIENRQSYRDIKKTVDEAVGCLKLIKDRADDHDIESVSGPMAKNIADGARVVAEYVEFVAVYAYHVESVLSSVIAIGTKIKTNFQPNPALRKP